MSTKEYKTSRKYKCPYCDFKATRGELVEHVEKKHEEMIPEDYTAARAVYDSINGKNYGICMICKKPVYEWNDKIDRYYNLCDDPKCRASVRKTAQERLIKVYNKTTLLNDPEHQEKMLAHRKISGTYTFTDGGKVTYTGQYEKKCLEFMDKVLNIPSKDIQAPGPVLEYEYNRETHRWITDIYYIPANLLIEVKDGGSNPNKRSMESYREKQVAKETMITNLGTFNYIRLTDNQFAQLLNIFADMKNEALTNQNPGVKIHINEAAKDDYISLTDKQKDAIRNIVNTFSKREIEYTGDADSIISYNHLYFDAVYENNRPIGFITVVQRISGPYGFIILGTDKNYRGRGIARSLAQNMLDYMISTKKCKTLTWNVDFDNKISAKIAKDIGFKFYKKWKTYDEYYYDLRTINEWAGCGGALPPQRPPEAYIIPYGMNNAFDGFAYGDSETDKILTISDYGTIVPMEKDEFEETYNVGIPLYYKDPDIRETMDKIHEAIKNNDKATGFLYFAELALGRKLKCYEEILLSESFKYYDKKREQRICTLIENGVIVGVKEGAITDSNVVKTIGYVYICQSPNGYYATTPRDFYMASEYFGDIESLMSSDVIQLMNDAYESNRSGGVHDVDE